jgi:hypothetical protein
LTKESLKSSPFYPELLDDKNSLMFRASYYTIQKDGRLQTLIPNRVLEMAGAKVSMSCSSLTLSILVSATLDILTFAKSKAFHLPTWIGVRESLKEEKDTILKRYLNAHRICVISRTYFKKKSLPV